VKTGSEADYDVVVIGAGPIGAVSARAAAAAGARVLLIERRTERESPSACTGLVSPRTLDALGVSKACVLRGIRSIEAHAPGGARLHLAAEADKAFVLDRPSLEEELRDRARSAGVELRQGVEATEFTRGIVHLRTRRGAEAVRAGVTIAAVGAAGRLSTGQSLPAPERTFVGVQAVVAQDADPPDQVSVYFGSDVAPGFFGWAVPAGEGEIRVGLAVPEGSNPSKRLARLLGRRFPGARILSRAAGHIPIGPISSPVRDDLLLVGDAAGHVKPLSGGGLYTGTICGRIAGRLAARAASAGATSREHLACYQAACDRAIGGELRFGLAARSLFESLGDEAVDDAFRTLDDPEFLCFLARVGDIDRLRMLPRHIASERTIWRRLVPLLTLLDRHVARSGPADAVAARLPDAL
jgi:digeranylgeranylglycerophospholipid reductase